MNHERELTELAAKAAGILGKWSERGNCILITDCAGMSLEWWRPLEDDGCAMRLAVSLGLIIDIDTDESWTDVDFTVNYEDRTIREGHGLADALGATRLAIVRAAAEIGRSTP